MTLPRSPRLVRALAVSACFMAAGLIGAQPSSARTYTCSSVPDYPDTSRGGYFSQLRVTGYRKSSACRSGRRLVLAYYRCRRAKGIRATCDGNRVNGLRCSEHRDPDLQNSTEINARVTCRSGSKKIVHNYQQNLTG